MIEFKLFNSNKYAHFVRISLISRKNRRNTLIKQGIKEIIP